MQHIQCKFDDTIRAMMHGVWAATNSQGAFLSNDYGITQAGKSKVTALKAKYAKSFDVSTTKWVTITSVNPPTNQVQKLCSIAGWNKVIVADKKTPKDWESMGCFFLSVEDQIELEYKIHNTIPYMRYERKMLGYLFAIEMGAQIILGQFHVRPSRADVPTACQQVCKLNLDVCVLCDVCSDTLRCLRACADTDDDNIPAASDPFVLQTDANGDTCADVVNRTTLAWNAYRHFGVPHLHNRGRLLMN